MDIPIPVRVSSVLLWISAIGLGIPCIMALNNLSHGRGIPFVFGFPAYGGGGFERHGLITSIPLIAGFLVVCLIDGYAGWLLWNGTRSGGILTLVLLIPEAIYWWGFDLPYPPILALIRTVLILISWSYLT